MATEKTDLLSLYADEGSGYVVEVEEFADHDGNAVTPTAISWSLSDADGTTVNDRDDETVTPAASVEIGLLAADTTAGAGDDVSGGYFVRRLLLQWTYDTTINGAAVTDYPGKKEVRIRIISYVNV